MNHTIIMIFVLGTVAVSLALRLICTTAWQYRPTQGRFKALVVAWVFLILLAAVASFLKPGWDVVFCVLFFGFVIGAQLRNIYMYRNLGNTKSNGSSVSS